MVYHKRSQPRWAVKAPAEIGKTYKNEFKQPGMRRTYSEETILSETSKLSGNSSGDESWSAMYDNAGGAGPSPSAESGRTKLSNTANLFIPHQPVQDSGEQRTRLSSGASMFVPGQLCSQQVVPGFNAQTQPVPMFMPQMVPMDQAMPYMATWPYCDSYMVLENSSWGICPFAVPAIPGAPPESVADECADLPPEPLETVKAEAPGREAQGSYAACRVEKDCKEFGDGRPKDPQFVGSPKSPSNASGRKRWADLSDDDDGSDDPWLQ